MSMYQIEDLVECSVRQLCQVETDSYQLRNDIYYLYEFQNQFDCSFTHFRVLQELLDCGFMIPLNPEDHPCREQEDFQRLTREDFDYTPGPAGGYWCGTIANADGESFELNKLFCDYGSPLWQVLVEEGKLSGEIARPLLPLDAYRLVSRVLRQVEVEKDPYLFIHWYAFFPMLADLGKSVGDADEGVKAELQAMLCRPEVFRALREEQRLAPEDGDFEEDGFEAEWFAPYFKWCEAMDNDPQQIYNQIAALFMKGDFKAAFELSKKGIQLQPEVVGFYLYWADSMILAQANEIIPFDAEENRKATRVLQESLIQLEGQVDPQNLYFYIAIGQLVAGEFDAAEATLSKITTLFEGSPALRDYYISLSEKWREKHIG